MTTNKIFRTMSGHEVQVGDVVDVLTYTVDGTEGGTVIGLSERTVRPAGRAASKVQMAVIQRADGSEIAERVLQLVPRKGGA